MPRPRTQKIYFGEDQEKAVVNYLESTDEAEKNKIFNEYLREPHPKYRHIISYNVLGRL